MNRRCPSCGSGVLERATECPWCEAPLLSTVGGRTGGAVAAPPRPPVTAAATGLRPGFGVDFEAEQRARRQRNRRRRVQGVGRFVRLLVVVALGAAVVAAVLLGVRTVSGRTPEQYVGACVEVDADASNAEVVDCTLPHDGVVVAVVDDERSCPPNTTQTVRPHTYRSRLLCIAPAA